MAEQIAIERGVRRKKRDALTVAIATFTAFTCPQNAEGQQPRSVQSARTCEQHVQSYRPEDLDAVMSIVTGNFGLLDGRLHNLSSIDDYEIVRIAAFLYECSLGPSTQSSLLRLQLTRVQLEINARNSGWEAVMDESRAHLNDIDYRAAYMETYAKAGISPPQSIPRN